MLTPDGCNNIYFSDEIYIHVPSDTPSHAELFIATHILPREISGGRNIVISVQTSEGLFEFDIINGGLSANVSF